MKVPDLIINPATQKVSEPLAKTALSTRRMLVLSLFGSAVAVLYVLVVIAELPFIAIPVIAMEIGFAVYMWVKLPQMSAARYREHLVAGSNLRGITVNDFTHPQQLWDAAVCVRDTGDAHRARMILGS